MSVADDQAARTQVRTPELPAVVKYLLEQLGERTTAVIAGVQSAGMVRAWAAGHAEPDTVIAARLRVAHEVTELLRQVDSAETVQLWFGGMNTELEDRAPALVIREDPEAVRSAARFFLAHG